MGDVWSAVDLKADRPVALKLIRRDYLDDPVVRNRFLTEARTLGRLEHDRIVTLYTVLEDGDNLALVLRLIDGDSLADRIDRGALPLDFVLASARDILPALGFAHSRGVIHRDIKSQNILIDREGRSFLTDFGIAAVEFAARGTQIGVSVGTPHYMSPEQISTPRDVTMENRGYRSDIYSYGVVLYEMLTGVLPFGSNGNPEEHFRVQRAHCEEAPVALRQIKSDIPAAIEDVVLRCLAKNPDDRPQSCQELLQLLERAAIAAPPMPPPASRDTVPRRPIPPTAPVPTPAAAGQSTVTWSVIAVALILGAVGVWEFMEYRNAAKPPSTHAGPIAGFTPLPGRIIDAVSPVSSMPEWLLNLRKGAFLSADNYPPPENFQIRDRCAGEGCGFQRPWRALKEVPLYYAWDAAVPQQVYVLAPHETAIAWEGIWITAIPAVFRVERPMSIAGVGLDSGDLIYSMMDLGGGLRRGFFHGKVAEFSLQEAIDRASVRKLRDYSATPWVQMITGSGVVGWTREGTYPSFDGQDDTSRAAPYVLARSGTQQNDLWDYEVQAFSHGRRAALRVGKESTSLPNPSEVQKTHTGFVVPVGVRSSIELVARDNGEVLAKTFVEPRRPFYWKHGKR
jgi:serine/threonine protein kinase